MSLSERIGDSLRSPAQRTAVYVVAFGLGSLAISALFSWIGVSVAESILPSPAASAGAKDAPSASASVRLPLGAASSSKPNGAARAVSGMEGSKAASGRGNDSPSGASE